MTLMKIRQEVFAGIWAKVSVNAELQIPIKSTGFVSAILGWCSYTEERAGLCPHGALAGGDVRAVRHSAWGGRTCNSSVAARKFPCLSECHTVYLEECAYSCSFRPYFCSSSGFWLVNHVIDTTLRTLTIILRWCCPCGLSNYDYVSVPRAILQHDLWGRVDKMHAGLMGKRADDGVMPPFDDGSCAKDLEFLRRGRFTVR